jgi:hypothetical protein
MCLASSAIRLWISTEQTAQFASYGTGFAGSFVIDPITLGVAVLGILLIALSFLG